jgi:hypothetical protein
VRIWNGTALWKESRSFLMKLTMRLLCDLPTPLLGIYPGEIKMCLRRDSYRNNHLG